MYEFFYFEFVNERFSFFPFLLFFFFFFLIINFNHFLQNYKRNKRQKHTTIFLLFIILDMNIPHVTISVKVYVLYLLRMCMMVLMKSVKAEI